MPLSAPPCPHEERRCTVRLICVIQLGALCGQIGMVCMGPAASLPQHSYEVLGDIAVYLVALAQGLPAGI